LGVPTESVALNQLTESVRRLLRAAKKISVAYPPAIA
jgi:hypothetical protein